MTPEVVKRVEAGQLGEAARLLGRPFEVAGVVVEGDRRGKLLGFPTANLALPPDQLLPPKGIYAGAALDRRAAISIGVNPHYGGTTLRVEAHLLDFDGGSSRDRKSTRLNSSHTVISYAVFCLKKKKNTNYINTINTKKTTRKQQK